MSDRVLHVENLTVDIPLATGILHAVDGVSLHVDRGETLCIVGESGCGKSLTSLALMDLLPTKATRDPTQSTVTAPICFAAVSAFAVESTANSPPFTSAIRSTAIIQPPLL